MWSENGKCGAGMVDGWLTKAQTLKRLEGVAQRPYIIDPFISFSVNEWRRKPEVIIQQIGRSVHSPEIIIRSSAAGEGVNPELPAGFYRSVLGVMQNDTQALCAAIELVIESYKRNRIPRSYDQLDEVIVQEQVTLVELAGVARNYGRTAGYLYVDYDESTGRTDTVTQGGACKSIAILRASRGSENRWTGLIRAMAAIENALNVQHPLIIEFAMSRDGAIHIFQARSFGRSQPMRELQRMPDSKVVAAIRKAQADWNPRWALSDMCDWNPAEMLGDRPRPLAVSLYQHLITNGAWNRARSSLGYRSVKGPLLEVILGKPYVRMELSFLSLTPASLESRLARRLARERLDRLREQPEVHDKVETNLLFTATDIGAHKRTSELLEHGFTRNEVARIDKHLKTLTNNIFRGYLDGLIADYAKGERLEVWRRRNHHSEPTDVDSAVRLVQASVKRCRENGVIPFARQARLAFIARDLLERLRITGLLTKEDLTAWWESCPTVAAEVASGLSQVYAGVMGTQEFRDQFGHLRVRTYDIESPRYRECESLQAWPLASRTSGDSVVAVGPPAKIDAALANSGISINSITLFNFAREATLARERLKFMFSRVVSDTLETIAYIGRCLGLDRGDASFLILDDFDNFDRRGLVRRWSKAIEGRRRTWEELVGVPLPPVVFTSSDLEYVQRLESRPNYVTENVIEAKTALLMSPMQIGQIDLTGRIVVVEAADPGCDWIFAFRLAGLVTKYGGAGSHMAVRCEEFRIPAALGCGEIFENLRDASVIRLDCGRKELRVVSRH